MIATINHDFAVWQCQNRHTGDRVDLGDILLALLKGMTLCGCNPDHRIASSPRRGGHMASYIDPKASCWSSGRRFDERHDSVANKRSESRTC